MNEALSTTDLWRLEDFVPGQQFELGLTAFAEHDILAFARRYDPQPFHVDPEAALRSPYGGLIASGWHSVVAVTRLWVDAVLIKTLSEGSPGVDEVRFLAPVRPGDALSATATVVEARASKSNPARGVLRAAIAASNQHSEPAMSFVSNSFVTRRGG